MSPAPPISRGTLLRDAAEPPIFGKPREAEMLV